MESDHGVSAILRSMKIKLHHVRWGIGIKCNVDDEIRILT